MVATGYIFKYDSLKHIHQMTRNALVDTDEPPPTSSFPPYPLDLLSSCVWVLCARLSQRRYCLMALGAWEEDQDILARRMLTINSAYMVYFYAVAKHIRREPIHPISALVSHIAAWDWEGAKERAVKMDTFGSTHYDQVFIQVNLKVLVDSRFTEHPPRICIVLL